MAARLNTACAAKLLPLLLLLGLPAVVRGQLQYTTNNGTIIITGYTGPGGDVTIPSTIDDLPVTGIGDQAFYRCGSLTNVTLSSNLTSIGQYAFMSCTNLANITIPSSVTNLGSVPFYRCPSLTAITVNASNSFYCSVDGVLFNKSQTTLIECPAGYPAIAYTIPDSVTNIGYRAFSGCVLPSVTFPGGLSSIGAYAFDYCTNLTSVTIPGGVTAIGSSSFSRCTSLTNVTIPGSVAVIETYTFSQCTSLTNVTIPSSVTNIAPYAFEYCTSLTSVVIPDSVTFIGFNVFQYCTSLASITIPHSVMAINVSTFSHCTSLTNVTMPDSADILSSAFEYCTSLASLTMPNRIFSIGFRTFAYCSNLTAVYFKGNAPLVSSSAFTGSTNAIVYYLPGTMGWDHWHAPPPLVLWDPHVETGDASFGVQANQFGFTITGANNLTIVVEACTNLANSIWSPVSTVTLTNGSAYFSDPQWANHPACLYRFRSP